MKVVAYMLMVILEVALLIEWALLTDGMTLIVGALVIGVLFGFVLLRISQYREVI